MDCKIGYVIVGVTDLERSIAFYRDAMGFEFVHAAPEFHFAEFKVGDMRFSLAGGGGGGDSAHKVGGNTGIGFVVDDLAASHNELAARGVSFTMEPSQQPWGGFMAMFADPDGNVFYLDQVQL
jgi:predicted enzyme related to lactoylglutathione lyase